MLEPLVAIFLSLMGLMIILQGVRGLQGKRYLRYDERTRKIVSILRIVLGLFIIGLGIYLAFAVL